jgi:hypothetical protein
MSARSINRTGSNENAAAAITSGNGEEGAGDESDGDGDEDSGKTATTTAPVRVGFNTAPKASTGFATPTPAPTPVETMQGRGGADSGGDIEEEQEDYDDDPDDPDAPDADFFATASSMRPSPYQVGAVGMHNADSSNANATSAGATPGGETPGTTQQLDSDDEASDDDDDAAFKPYAMKDDSVDPNAARPPAYIRDAVKGLQSKDDPAKVEAAFRALEGLVRSNPADLPELAVSTVRAFRQKLTLEDAVGFHACSLEASMHVTMPFLSGVHCSYRLTL